MTNVFPRFLHGRIGRHCYRILIAAGIALAIITAVNSVGSSLNGIFTSVNTSVK
jgi:pilus assembly protein Flp/PilA